MKNRDYYLQPTVNYIKEKSFFFLIKFSEKKIKVIFYEMRIYFVVNSRGIENESY